MSGITGTQCELLYSLAAPVTKNTYTTQACMSALAASAAVARIPGGFFQESPDPSRPYASSLRCGNNSDHLSSDVLPGYCPGHHSRDCAEPGHHLFHGRADSGCHCAMGPAGDHHLPGFR